MVATWRAPMRHGYVLARFLLCAMLGLLLTAVPPRTQSADASAAKPNTSWDLGDLYPTLKDWEDSFTRTQASINRLEDYKGTLGTSADAMLKALIAVSDMDRASSRLYVYTSLASDEDVRVSANLERNQRARALLTLFSEKTAWIGPEVLRVGATKVNSFTTQ